MRKWRKVLLGVIFICGIVGGLIGYMMGKFGVAKVKFWANIDMFSFFMFGLLLIMGISIVVDIYGIHKSKKQFGHTKFKMMIYTRKGIRNVLIFLVIDTIFLFGIFLSSQDMNSFFLFLMILILTLMQGMHYRIENGISENGILHWGVFHSWNDVKSYKIEDKTLLEMSILSKVCGFKYNNKIKFNFDKSDKDNIEMFLENKFIGGQMKCL